MPLMLRELLEHAIEQSNCELLRDTRDGLEILTQQGAAPDVIVLGLSAAEDATLVPVLFARWPMAQVVTVRMDDDTAVYELRPHRRLLGQMSPTEIVETLREAVHESRELLRG